MSARARCCKNTCFFFLLASLPAHAHSNLNWQTLSRCRESKSNLKLTFHQNWIYVLEWALMPKYTWSDHFSCNLRPLSVLNMKTNQRTQQLQCLLYFCLMFSQDSQLKVHTFHSHTFATSCKTKKHTILKLWQRSFFTHILMVCLICVNDLRP